ncbi:MAG: ParB N-terminal domain-containing protein [Janthinobacterium lividum]
MSNPAIQVVPIEQVKLNEANPRLIKDNRFEQLVQSLIDFPDMLHVRPLVVDENNVVLGGNMRLHAALRLGYHEIPILQVLGWSEHQKREFLIKDNASFGEWNFEVLANEWSMEPLGAWGIDLPKDWLGEPAESGSGGGGADDSPDGDEEQGQQQRPLMTITFTSPEDLQQAEIDVQELLDRKYPTAAFTVRVGEREG